VAAETLPLRPYQQRAVNALYGDYARGVRRSALVIPTGGGKTVVGSRPVADCVTAGDCALWLAHRTELIEQAEEALKGNTQGLGVGVLQATRRETHMPTIVGSIGTVARPGGLGLVKRRRPRLIVIDECHHAAARSYQHILSELGAFDPGGPLVLGLTATLGRTDGLALGDTFESVAETISIGELIEAGHLLPPKGVRVKVEGLDLSGVRASRTSESGLDDRAVTRAMSDSLAPAAVARAVLEHCKGRHGVAFWPSVELSKEAARVFAEHGLRSVHVDADTPKVVRKEIMKRARAGEYDTVHNVGLFTEGTDVPLWSYVVLGRLTSSEVLFTQMAGRGLRPYPGQTDCVVLDPVGVTGRHKLRSVVRLDGVEMIDDLDDELAAFDEPQDETEPTECRTPTETELPEGADGSLVHELVDLFGASHVAWQRSPRGAWFLPVGAGRAVVLAPNEPGLYDVRWNDGNLVHEDPCDIAAAMSWGEAAAKQAAERPLERGDRARTRRLTREERLLAIYAGQAPGGAETPLTAGALTDVQDARWAAEALDGLPWLAGVTPYGYWTS
jgi:superfamily II DNA or RNA helicase